MRLETIFAIAATQAERLIRTSGTTVAVRTVTRTDDPDTLQIAEVPSLGDPQPAIITTAATGAYATEVIPGVVLRIGDWRVTALPDFTPAKDSELQVVTCRDGRLVEKVGTVLGVNIDSPGAVTTIYVRPLP